MTLYEMSFTYRQSETALRLRIRELRELRRTEEDPEERWRLERRIAALLPLAREAAELAVLTARYYDRSYHRNEDYIL